MNKRISLLTRSAAVVGALVLGLLALVALSLSQVQSAQAAPGPSAQAHTPVGAQTRGQSDQSQAGQSSQAGQPGSTRRKGPGRSETPQLYPVQIIKYTLDVAQKQAFIDSGDAINNLPVRYKQDLKALPGVSYLIQEVTQTDYTKLPSAADPTTYRPVGQPLSLVTDRDGLAQTKLKEGYYLVSEQANPALRLTRPADPIIVSLPTTWNNQDGVVSIYPKSSIDPLPAPAASASAASAAGAGAKLAATGSQTAVVVLAALVLLVLAALLLVGSRKEALRRSRPAASGQARPVARSVSSEWAAAGLRAASTGSDDRLPAFPVRFEHEYPAQPPEPPQPPQAGVRRGQSGQTAARKGRQS